MSNEKIESISIRLDDSTGKFSLNYNVVSENNDVCGFEYECLVGLEEERFAEVADYVLAPSAE